MIKKLSCGLCVLLLIAGSGIRAQESDSTSSGTSIKLPLGVGYEEGLSAKYLVIDKVFANLSIGYNLAGADTVTSQPLQELLLKVGGGYYLWEFSRLKVAVFGDFVEQLEQFETEEVLSGNNPAHKRYNVWSSFVRAGLCPEIQITDRFSISYKFGVQWVFHGTHYKLNANGNDTESMDNSHQEFGVYGVSGRFADAFLHNLGIHIYLF